MIEPFRAYVDESLRLSVRRYLMAAVFVPGDRAESHRAVLRGLLRRRQRRLHWRDEDDQRRVALVAAIAELRPRGIVVIGEGMDPRHQERARRKCMECLLWQLGERAVPEAIFESRNWQLDGRDRRMIDALGGKHAMPPGLRVKWQSPEIEPLLWLADVVAGAASSAEAGQEAHWKELGAGLAVHRLDLG
ncbi:MAG TPA: hypothetical protein VFU43_26505 [Streptosporangiaceae bacterium]|nr:hypothetical protein [Streptosporangiaceae bacterium]